MLHILKVYKHFSIKKCALCKEFSYTLQLQVAGVLQIENP